MKKFLNIVLIAILLLVNQAFAQEQISREEFAKSQASRFAKEIGLNDDQTEKYIENYISCQKEIWGLGPRLTNSSNSKDNINARFERSQQILSIRKKYYDKYSEFMTQEQIEKSYKLEHESMERLSKLHHK